VKYTREYEKKQAILRELRSYKGNKRLLEFYQNILSKKEEKKDYQKDQCTKDMKRVKQNIQSLNELIHTLPEKERGFAIDVFIDETLTQKEIVDKYEITVSVFHYRCDKIAQMLIDTDIN